jgi:hypothetical protein
VVDWIKEKPLIVAACVEYGLDAAFVMAIRVAENGAPGREFGVLSVSAPTYADQLRICCETVAHRLETYLDNPTVRNGTGRIIYRAAWIHYFASIWAPGDANNDPNHLNSNWFLDTSTAYRKYQNETNLLG